MSEEPENTEVDEVVETPDAGASSAGTASNAADEVSAPGSTAEPQEVLPPKERRARARAAKAAKGRAKRVVSTPEERQELRAAERKRKAAGRRVERQRSRAKARANRGDVAATPAREHQPGVQKVRQGIVVSDKADKTITVRIEIARRHRRYEKIVRTSRRLHAHDEKNDAHVGDTVLVREARPLSRSKRWRLVEVLERAK